MNGDGASHNDLIYIPRDDSEMNFQRLPPARRTFTAGRAGRRRSRPTSSRIAICASTAANMPSEARCCCRSSDRADLSITQDLFTNIRGRRNAFQLRVDILNLGNMLNSDWGVGQRLIRNQILTNGAADAQGRATYRLVVVNNELLTRSFETTASLSDVFSFMISLRYTFN